MACLEEVFRNLRWDDLGIKIDGEYLNLRIADDIVLLSESEGKMIEKLNRESKDRAEDEYEEN